MKKAILVLLLKLLSIVPLSFNRILGSAVGVILKLTGSRMYHTSKVNIDLCYPELSEIDKTNLLDKSCKNIGQCFTEAAWFWGRDIKEIDKNVSSVKGLDLLHKNEQGTIFVSLHLGNWEFLVNWLPQNLNLMIMYREFKSKNLDAEIRQRRERTGATLIEGKRENIDTIREHLKQGNEFLILSDQEPKQGSGVFVDFFGHTIYSMTTVQKLAKRTKAKLVFVTLIRGARGFEVELEELPIEYETDSLQTFATKLNRIFEEKINQHPEQYQWSYKRFKSSPDNSPNPYYK